MLTSVCSGGGGGGGGEPLGSVNANDFMSAALGLEDFFDSPPKHQASFPLHNGPNGQHQVKTEATADAGASIFDFFPAASSSCALQAQAPAPQPKADADLFDTFTQPQRNHNAAPPAEEGGGDVDGSLEVYRELILRHLVSDIAQTCARLNISSEPWEWTGESTVVWAEEMGRQFALPRLPTERLGLPGRRLASLSREELLGLCPEAGETLHAQLEIWKTAADFQRRGGEPEGQETPLSMVQPSAPRFPSTTSSEASEWLSGWDSPADEPLTPQPAAWPAPQHTLHHQPYPLSVHTPHYALHQGQAQAKAVGPGGQYARLLSPSDSDSGISADLDDVTAAAHHRLPHLPGHSTGSIHLWQFIRELLDHPDKYAQCVRWMDRTEGVFKIEDSHKLARLWGQRKNRHKMNYDKLSRSLRQYYKKGIIRKTGQRQRLIYQFIPPYHLL